MVVFTAVLQSLGLALAHVLASPFQDLSVLWQLIPLLLMWLILEIYFVHWHEQLGWNSALANAITLLWVVVTMMQVIFGNAELWSWTKFIILMLGLLYAILLVYITFKHSLNEKWAFMIGSPAFILFACMVFILWAHGSLEISWQVFIILVFFYGFFLVLTHILKKYFGRDSQETQQESSLSDDPFSSLEVESAESSPSAESTSSFDTQPASLTPSRLSQPQKKSAAQRRKNPFK